MYQIVMREQCTGILKGKIENRDKMEYREDLYTCLRDVLRCVRMRIEVQMSWKKCNTKNQDEKIKCGVYVIV